MLVYNGKSVIEDGELPEISKMDKFTFFKVGMAESVCGYMMHA